MCAPSISSNWAIERALAGPEGSRSDCGKFVENRSPPQALDLPTSEMTYSLGGGV